jgi:predicted transcriptional regulator
MEEIDLEIRELSFVEEFLNDDDQHAARPIPGVPNTVEALKEAVRQGMDDYLNGRVISQEELKKEIASW